MMPPEPAARSPNYLRAILMDGMAPFRYRSRIHSLLGSTAEPDGTLAFAPTVLYFDFPSPNLRYMPHSGTDQDLGQPQGLEYAQDGVISPTHYQVPALSIARQNRSEVTQTLAKPERALPNEQAQIAETTRGTQLPNARTPSSYLQKSLSDSVTPSGNQSEVHSLPSLAAEAEGTLTFTSTTVPSAIPSPTLRTTPQLGADQDLVQPPVRLDAQEEVIPVSNAPALSGEAETQNRLPYGRQKRSDTRPSLVKPDPALPNPQAGSPNAAETFQPPDGQTELTHRIPTQQGTTVQPTQKAGGSILAQVPGGMASVVPGPENLPTVFRGAHDVGKVHPEQSPRLSLPTIETGKELRTNPPASTTAMSPSTSVLSSPYSQLPSALAAQTQTTRDSRNELREARTDSGGVVGMPSSAAPAPTVRKEEIRAEQTREPAKLPPVPPPRRRTIISSTPADRSPELWQAPSGDESAPESMPERPFRKALGQERMREPAPQPPQTAPAAPAPEVIIVHRRPDPMETRHAFWERSYLRRVRSRILR